MLFRSVHLPRFLTRKLGQSDPLASASNVLTLTIVPNCEVSPGSNVTLVGLTGSATDDTMSLDVSSGDQEWFLSTGEWRRTEGYLRVVVGGSGLRNGSVYSVSFMLQNKNDTQEPPAVSIKMTVKSSVGPDDGEGVYEDVEKSGESAVGVARGAEALRVYVPGFRTKLIWQRNPLVSASNNLSVMLEPNCDVAEIGRAHV